MLSISYSFLFHTSELDNIVISALVCSELLWSVVFCNPSVVIRWWGASLNSSALLIAHQWLLSNTAAWEQTWSLALVMAASFEDCYWPVWQPVHHPPVSGAEHWSADSFNHTRQALVSLRHFPTASVRSSEQRRSPDWGRPPKCVQRKPETPSQH